MGTEQRLTGDELKAELAARGIFRQNEAAKRLGIHPSRISRYINNIDPVPPIVRVALRGIPKLRRNAGSNPDQDSNTSEGRS